MDDGQPVVSVETSVPGISRGQVVLLEIDGSVLVSVDGPPRHVLCDLLEQAQGARLRLAPDDAVLVWLPSEPQGRGVVLGRVGPSHDLTPETPEELVIDATKNLTLKCGAGSITIREDGKILIKGKDLVSHAQRLNRIRGGAVQIN